MRVKGAKEVELLLEHYGIPFVAEHRFAPPRKFRFDFALPEYMIAIEFEGMGGKDKLGVGGHRSWSGYLTDVEKYNLAVEHGWRLFRCVSGKIKPECSPAVVVGLIKEIIQKEDAQSCGI